MMNCNECKDIGNRVMNLFIEDNYTLDEAKIALEKVLESINVIIDLRNLQ
jgi:hypothetical protein